ncbi:MAG TPA: hypothetical protein GXZ28_00345 [Clostridiales bacterium]|nr:hypothetical protein [Clostridiales bacterium]
MKEIKNKKPIILLALLCFLIGSTPAYASTILNSSSFEYLKDFFNTSLPSLLNQVNSETNYIKEKTKSGMNEYIRKSTNQVLDDVDRHIDDEIAQVEEDINLHMNALYEELEAQMEIEKERLKDVTSTFIETRKDSIKKELSNDLTEEIRRYFIENVQ